MNKEELDTCLQLLSIDDKEKSPSTASRSLTASGSL